jgi:rubrerythrin
MRDVYEQLAKAGARVTYFCAYCGHEFEDPPSLPARCPRCGRELAGFSTPVVEPARPRARKR